MPVESEPVQAFGCQQPNSVKKGAKKLSKLERKALRQVKQSLKEAQLKEQAKLSEIPQEEEAKEEQEQQQAESESAQADEPVQAASKEENAHAVLNNLSDVRLRCSLMRIIDKINDMWTSERTQDYCQIEKSRFFKLFLMIIIVLLFIVALLL